MQRGQFLIGVIVGGLAGGLLGVWFVLPDERSAKNGFVFDANVEEVWAVFTDPASQADWRSDIQRVEMIAGPGRRQWVEYPQNGPAIEFTEIYAEPLKMYALEMKADGAFTGQYTAEFQEQDDTSTIGYFSETVELQGLFPKIMSYLFVNQREFTRTYCLNAQAEIERRRAASN